MAVGIEQTAASRVDVWAANGSRDESSPFFVGVADTPP